MQTTPFIDVLNQYSPEQLISERDRLRAQAAQLSAAPRLLDLAIAARSLTGSFDPVPEVELGPDQRETVSSAFAAYRNATMHSMLETRPPLRLAIVGVMSEAAPGMEWRPSDIHRALGERGWSPNGSAARSQISNRLGDLIRDGQVKRVGNFVSAGPSIGPAVTSWTFPTRVS